MKKLFFATILMLTSVSLSFAMDTSLKDIEDYLNNITTFEADFQQYSPGAPYTTGTFYLNRPKQFLWQYKVPSHQKLVSTGSKLFFYDPETEQATQLPLNSGFAAILTKVPFSLNNKDFTVRQVSTSDHITTIDLSSNKEGEGYFVLKFSNKPIQLLSMSSKDAFGGGVTVLFSHYKQGHILNKDLFKFTPELEKFSLNN